MARNNPVMGAMAQGRKEGREGLRKEVLDWLEAKYMAPEIERKTPEAEAILSLARELSLFMKV